MKTIATLKSLTTLDVVGKNALSYLQGQLTADIRRVSSQHMVRSALCCLKGRVIALFDVLPSGDGFSLVLPKDLAQIVYDALKKSAMFSRVELKPNDDYHYFGYIEKEDLHLAPTAISKTDDGCIYQPMPGFFICQVQKTHLSQFIEAHSQWGAMEEEAFFANALLDGFCQIRAKESGLFLPHRLNLHLQEVISFDKGCYRGQEIIARTHYRATPKHELYIAKTDARNVAALSPGDSLQTKEGKPLGEWIESFQFSPEESVYAASLYIERDQNPFS